MMQNLTDVQHALFNKPKLIMRYKIFIWTIEKLLATYAKKEINLNPGYQRNDIWTEKSQSELITSIKKGMPIPNFFLHDQPNGIFDIADGQQRTRTLIAYEMGEISDSAGVKFNPSDRDFLNYSLAIIIIDKTVTQDEIRDFYVKVNNNGLRVNSPELTKSRYYNSKILKLVEELSELSEVQSLGLFSQKQEERMLDREFMEELVSQIVYGITEKKLAIKKLYEENTEITQKKINEIKKQFKDILKVYSSINKVIDITSTRYVQKNDFYTLFGLIKDYALKQNLYDEIFKFLIKIQDDISPSNSDCSLLQQYAFNCITQSHGKPAREKRYEIIKNIAFNETATLTKEQKQLIKYYGLKTTDTYKKEGFLFIDYKKIENKFSLN
jgi:hypothetical protein